MITIGAFQELKNKFGQRFKDSPADKLTFSKDKWLKLKFIEKREKPFSHLADGVVEPAGTDEIQWLVQWAVKNNVPLIPRGGGSGVCGAAVPVNGGIVIDMSSLNRIWGINYADEYIWVESGIMGNQIEKALQVITPENFYLNYQYTCGHSPASLSISTPGGWIATRSAGQFSSIYGTIEDLVLAIEAVNEKGERELIKGDDLKRFFRMEGSSGIITKVKMRIFPVSPFRQFLAFRFDDSKWAMGIVKAVSLLMERHENTDPHCVVRLYDSLDAAVNGPRIRDRRTKKANLAERFLLKYPTFLNKIAAKLEKKGKIQPLLVVMIQPPLDFYRCTNEQLSNLMAEKAFQFKDIISSFGGTFVGSDLAEAWYNNRFKLTYENVERRFEKGIFVETFDTTVPLDCVLEVYTAVKNAVSGCAVVLAHLSHIINETCCIYFTFAGKGRNLQETELLYDKVCDKSARAAIDAGAFITHHHGIGLKNIGYARYAYGSEWFMETREFQSDIFNPKKL
ncbi:MAG: hypothetical protein A2736_01955 [Candidatus Yanofskybacteria bacterium RIFCSPHIGHO2_01_FULL_41_27]|uniref:FAD-binding PCMH-type domain-containing protein n=3 Tax=Parcubacteria group TaxID=1794811 RepID=A0A0G0ZSD2_9BACT|nr:MAG: hypothetical protein UU83_C0016G0005 [Candidatus Jorgensenbacteria bacterium GW2011_GWF2_41_8]KKS25550.1 MAG: hypothetical protein UU84_C0041G0002 [Candidatus Yanofskybacteria bacterium GW2011_GWC2_41_9]OGM99065.1 MAG: hypothetical protein A2736_01955 [Candidatus Yanofskybacteria bacterium RIFCSPHIGHO2_01_FULL_41_27]OGN20609.1 MAG: hypothetical protein A3B00_02150 [Candidatus Yanofskybacteria bacterium RIFCSPLOWO2_01_FULL_41_33]